MKDYKKYREKIRKMACFCDIHQVGYPNECTPVNMYFQMCEAYVIGYKFYISYCFGTWSIDYSLDNTIKCRSNMTHIRGIKTDRDMLAKVQEIIHMYRKECGVA